MKATSRTDHVQSLHSSNASDTQYDSLNRHDRNVLRSCKYCNRKHEFGKETCLAYGQVCRRCQNHYESVCQSMVAGSSKKENVRHHNVNEINETETDEELMTLGGVYTERWYTKLNIEGHTVRFLLDCGGKEE